MNSLVVPDGVGQADIGQREVRILGDRLFVQVPRVGGAQLLLPDRAPSDTARARRRTTW